MKWKFTLAIVLACWLTTASTVFAQVVINEFSPVTSPEWVEFHNASDSAEYLKSYWLDDDTLFDSDAGSSSKKLLTALNTDNIHFPYFETKSFLNNYGDYVVLFDPKGNIADQYHYIGDIKNDLTIGRSPNQSGNFFVLASATKGSANSQPLPSPNPTSTPDPTPKSTPNPSPAIVPTPIATLQPFPSATSLRVRVSPLPTATPATASGSVLSDTTAAATLVTSSTPSASPSSISGWGSRIGSILLIVGGLILSAGAGVLAYVIHGRKLV